MIYSKGDPIPCTNCVGYSLAIDRKQDTVLKAFPAKLTSYFQQSCSSYLSAFLNAVHRRHVTQRLNFRGGKNELIFDSDQQLSSRQFLSPSGIHSVLSLLTSFPLLTSFALRCAYRAGTQTLNNV